MNSVGKLMLLSGLAAIASTAAARETPRSSWGRAGIGIDQCRADSVECGRIALGTDIADLDAVKTLLSASQQIDTLLQSQQTSVAPVGTNESAVADLAQQINRTVEGANAPARFREVRAVLVGAIEQCLTGKGYVRFDLTADQRKQLRRLKIGSSERHAYLHALASDPAVLLGQRPAPLPLPTQGT